MPTVYFHGGQFWAMAREARDRTISAVKAKSENPPDDAIVAIFFPCRPWRRSLTNCLNGSY